MPVTLHQFFIIVCVLPPFAYLATIIRLSERIRRHKLWWDDAWALFAMVFAILTTTGSLLHIDDPTKHSQAAKVSYYYLVTQAYYCANWGARMSILYTIIRIQVNNRSIMYGVAGSFVLIWAVLFAQVFWVCEKEPGWKEAVIPQCALGKNVAIAQVITDVITDAILIVAPIKLLWSMNITRAQKIRLITIFAATIITTAVSLVHAYFVMVVGGLEEATAATFQYCASLIVANLNVIVAIFFRIATEDRVVKTAGFNVTSMRFNGKLGRTRDTDDTYTNNSIILTKVTNETINASTTRLGNEGKETWNSQSVHSGPTVVHIQTMTENEEK